MRSSIAPDASHEPKHPAPQAEQLPGVQRAASRLGGDRGCMVVQRLSRLAVLTSVVAAASLSGVVQAAEVAPGFAALEGRWSCAGHFISSGRPIASWLVITADTSSGALVVRHDDQPPAAYHALELWSVAKPGAGLRATIVDAYSGMRWLESPGWQGPNLVWTRFEAGAVAEQFAYRLQPGGGLTIDWSTARTGAMTLGDTLACTRAPPPGLPQ